MKRTKPQQEGILAEIRQPKLYLQISIFGEILGTLIVLILLLLPDSMIDAPKYIYRLLFCCPFIGSQLGLGWFILFQLNWKIEVKKNEFIFTNSFKKRKIYMFDEINEKVFSACYRYYRNGKHIVSISFLLENCDSLSIVLSAYKCTSKKEDRKCL